MSDNSTNQTKSNGSAGPLEPPRLAPLNAELFRGVRVSLEARLGEAAMTVDEIMALKSGSVVTLHTSLADRVDLYLSGSLVARGEIVAVGDKFGVRIIEVAPP